MLPSLLLLLCTTFTPTAGVVLWPVLKHGAASHRHNVFQRDSWNTSAAISNQTRPVKAAVSKPSLNITEQSLSKTSKSSPKKAPRPNESASIFNNTGPVKAAVSKPSLNITEQSLGNKSESLLEKAPRPNESASISKNTDPVKAAFSDHSLNITGPSIGNISKSSLEKALRPNNKSASISNNTGPVKAVAPYPFLNITGQSLSNISNSSLEQALWPSLDAYNNFLDQCLLWDDQCTGSRTEALDLFFNNSGSLYNEVYGSHCIWSREIQCAPWLASPAVLPKLLEWLRQPECVESFYDYHTQNADQPPWTWSARMFDGWSTHTIDWNTIATTTSNIGCCGQCNVFGGNVDVYYWPVPEENNDCVSTIGTSFNNPDSELMVTDDRGFPYWKIQTNPWGQNDTQTVDPNTIPQPQALDNGGVNPLSVATYIQAGDYLRAREYLQKNITLAANVSNAEAIATIGNFRCTSPSACVGFSNIYAADGCGVLSTDGQLISYTIIAFAPGELSTIEIPAWVRSSVPPKAAIKSFNFADLPCPPQSVMYAVEYKPALGNPYRPVLSAPSRLSSLLPEWSKSGCVISAALFNGVDPPRALSAAEILTPGVSQVVPTPSVAAIAAAVAAVAAPASSIQVNVPSKTPSPSSVGKEEASTPSDPDTSESGSGVSDNSTQDTKSADSTNTDPTDSQSDDSDVEKSTTNNANPQDPENPTTDSQPDDSEVEKSTANVADRPANNADTQDPEDTTTNSQSDGSEVEKSTSNDADSQDTDITTSNSEDSNKEESTPNNEDPQDVGTSAGDTENNTTDSSDSEQLDPGNPGSNNANPQTSNSQNTNPQVLDGQNVSDSDDKETSNLSPDLSQPNIPGSASDTTDSSNEGSENLPSDENSSGPDGNDIPSSGEQELDALDPDNPNADSVPGDSEHSNSLGQNSDGNDIPSSGEQELEALDPNKPNADSVPGESEQLKSLGQDTAIAIPDGSPAAESEAYDGEVPNVTGSDSELDPFDTLPANLNNEPSSPTAEPIGEGQYSTPGDPEDENPFGPGSSNDTPSENELNEIEAPFDKALSPQDSAETLSTAEADAMGDTPGNLNDAASENELNKIEAPFDNSLSPQDLAEALSAAETGAKGQSSSNDTPSENELNKIEAPFDNSLSPQDLAEALSAAETNAKGQGNSNDTPSENELNKIEEPFDEALESIKNAEADAVGAIADNSNNTQSENELNEIETPFDKALEDLKTAEADAVGAIADNPNDTPSENELNEIKAPFNKAVEDLKIAEADVVKAISNNSNDTPSENELNEIEAPFDKALEDLKTAEADALGDIPGQTAPGNVSANASQYSASVAAGVSGKTGFASSSGPTASAAASGLPLGSGGVSDDTQQGNGVNATGSGKAKSTGTRLLVSRRQPQRNGLLSAGGLFYHSCIYLLPWLLILI